MLDVSHNAGITAKNVWIYLQAMPTLRCILLSGTGINKEELSELAEKIPMTMGNKVSSQHCAVTALMTGLIGGCCCNVWIGSQAKRGNLWAQIWVDATLHAVLLPLIVLPCRNPAMLSNLWSHQIAKAVGLDPSKAKTPLNVDACEDIRQEKTSTFCLFRAAGYTSHAKTPTAPGAVVSTQVTRRKPKNFLFDFKQRTQASVMPQQGGSRTEQQQQRVVASPGPRTPGSKMVTPRTPASKPTPAPKTKLFEKAAPKTPVTVTNVSLLVLVPWCVTGLPVL